jgi:hypothetical protein
MILDAEKLGGQRITIENIAAKVKEKFPNTV